MHRRSSPRRLCASSESATSPSTTALALPANRRVGPTSDTADSRRGLGRSQLLRQSAPLSPLHPEQYRALSTSTASALASGEYLKPEAESTDPANPFDPGNMDTMMEGMKKQAVMMVPNMLIMQYINVFFSGYILSA